MSGWHPYKDAPRRSFWSGFEASGFATGDVPRPLPEGLRPGARVASAGSCFAANMVPYLEQHGFEYVREEYQNRIHRALAPENLSYAKFSAAYGNIYTTRQLLQLVRRCTGEWRPAEDRWPVGNIVLDPFRPGLRYCARSPREFELLTAQHLEATRRVFERADVFVFTLGLTEAWESKVDGAVFPACPGTVAGTFHPERHRFVNFSLAEVRNDLYAALVAIRSIHPSIDFVLTVSPVPLVATAAGGHVLEATTYSKSVLRVAAEEVARSLERVAYFPAYEIITGPQAPREFMEADRRNVTSVGVAAVMEAFFAGIPGVDRAPSTDGARAAERSREDAVAELSARIVERECEEAFADVAAPGGSEAR